MLVSDHLNAVNGTFNFSLRRKCNFNKLFKCKPTKCEIENCLRHILTHKGQNAALYFICKFLILTIVLLYLVAQSNYSKLKQ